ncbi:MAG TPA: HlyD family efflux transporter periplasmic adaptor subunit [Nevskiaceae bacterium]|nr:HlyD family efflux transporter periplasmic adaptor subunit [Nevskiaceae bacterium]
MRVAEPIPLEVLVQRRPQWGRWIYLAIILLIAAGIAKIIFDHVFWYNASGVVAGQRYTVSSIYPATVRDILVKPSQKVQQGQPLVELDSPQLRSQLAQDSASLARMQEQSVTGSSANQVAVLKAQERGLNGQSRALASSLAAQDQQIGALKALIAEHAANAGGLVPLESDRAKVQAQYDTVRAQLQGVGVQLHNIARGAAVAGGDGHKELLKSLREQRASLHSQLADLTLRAPVSGEVAQVKVTDGSVLRPGDEALVIVTGDDRRTYLFFPPAAQDRLQIGQKVSVTGPDGSRLRMRLTNIYPSLRDMPGSNAPTLASGSPRVVAAAEPLNGASWPPSLRSGTPVNSRVSRWAAPSKWWGDAKDLVASVGSGIHTFFERII